MWFGELIAHTYVWSGIYYMYACTCIQHTYTNGETYTYIINIEEYWLINNVCRLHILAVLKYFFYKNHLSKWIALKKN